MGINKPDHAAVATVLAAASQCFQTFMGRTARRKLSAKAVTCFANEAADSYVADVTMTVYEGRQEVLGVHASVTFIQQRDKSMGASHIELKLYGDRSQWRLGSGVGRNNKLRALSGLTSSD